ncbi:hypothetical protein BDZ94DRAFT_1124206, partial [Collybia nuda]
AFHDSIARYPPPNCNPGTREDVIHEIMNWITHGDNKILWLCGPAGAGKSAIVQYIAECCEDKLTLAASFFFFHADPGRNTIAGLVSSITYQIITRMRHKRAQIGTVIEEDPSILHKPFKAQIEHLIYPLLVDTPSNNINESPASSGLPSVIIIDGLDECQGDNDQREIVQSIGALANITRNSVRFIVASRPEPPINQSFHSLPSIRKILLSDPHRIQRASGDIYLYLRHGFDQIYQKHRPIVESFWPTDSIISKLVHKSGGLFIYPSIVLKY